MSIINFIKKYAIFIIGALVIVLLLISYFLVWPEFQDYRVTKRNFDLKDEEIKAKEEYLPKLIAISNKLEEEASKIEIIESALPEDPSVAALYEYFGNLTSQNGLILEEMDVSTLFTDEDNLTGNLAEMNEMIFSTTLIGSYESFKSFLADLYLNARIIEVESIQLISLETVEGNPVGDIFNFILTLKTQSYNQVSQVKNYGG